MPGDQPALLKASRAICELITLARLPLPLPFGAVDSRRSLLAIENLVAAICLSADRLVNDGAFMRTPLGADC